ncbi:MAG: ATP-dependent helicase [Taibaiella sp.]|nr:ATP-dependent helicase [Taibaiella sp.]
MTIDENIYHQRYEVLNERQREAVDTIFGPVMVIAGPGTGKTEVLSMRIANLLRSEAQVQPHEILCLTYTDEATNAMRRRLVHIVGTMAHKVNIHTFHAFCNNVIQNNSEYFSLRSLQPITDLERTELMYDILEQLPQGHILRRLGGNIYNDSGKINRLFDLMKRENMTPEFIETSVKEYLDDLPGRQEFIYSRAYREYKKGDLKQDKLDEEAKKMEHTIAAAKLYEIYAERMKEMGRYDFNDMIIWVLEAFKTHPALLQSYQERHQFILVDEFQDTNGSQNELLNMLTEYWGEDSNIFAVGDDDQSIYEFQGARIRNIIDFFRRYERNIRIVVLPHNYRSSQPILDKASASIKNNRQRLIYQLHELNLDKDIISSHPRFKDPAEVITPVVKVYNNVLQEEAAIVLQIEQMQQAGVPLRDVAVLSAQHKQTENIIALLERKGIPYNIKRPVDILDEPIVQQLITVLQYLEQERKETFFSEGLLFEIMHAPYYSIDPTDIALVSLYMQHNKSKDKALGYWRLVLMNDLLLESMGLQTAKALRRMGRNIESWQRHQPELPLPLLLEKIVYESGMVDYLLHTKEYVWRMQVLNTFFEFVKETHSRDRRLSLSGLLRMLDRMQAEKIAIPVQRVIQNDNGIHFYSAHGAKGNEFEHVFIIGCTKNYWEGKGGGRNEYKLPDTITRTEDDTEKTYKVEEARRLFYVALTRARKHLYVSYASIDSKGKPLEPSLFIDEISTQEEREANSVGTEAMLQHMQWAMAPVPDVRIALANNQWLDRVLLQLTMSYTTLSKYLRCPLAFYYESLLRVPILKNDALAFGSAVHNALERFFKTMKEKKGEFPDKDYLVGVFNSAMYAESGSFTQVQFTRRMEQGHTILAAYYDTYVDTFSKNVEIEFKIPRYSLDGVPVTGKIDKIELDGDTCIVIDYKTGDPDKAANPLTSPPNEKEPAGGDYWRQMVFYKLLIENYQDRNWKVSIGMFDFIEKGKRSNEYKRIRVPMYAQDELVVRAQLKEVYTRIMNHDFDKGCGKEECHWCNFARKYELVRPSGDMVVEIDDI